MAVQRVTEAKLALSGESARRPHRELSHTYPTSKRMRVRWASVGHAAREATRTSRLRVVILGDMD